MAGFLAAIVSREKITEEEIEKLKQGDILETTFSHSPIKRKILQTID